MANRDDLNAWADLLRETRRLVKTFAAAVGLLTFVLLALLWALGPGGAQVFWEVGCRVLLEQPSEGRTCEISQED